MTSNTLVIIAYRERNLAEVEHYSADLIELSTRHHFAHWMAIGAIYRGWARSASGDTAEGILWIEDGIRNGPTARSWLCRSS